MIVMKKKYQTPTAEIISLGITEVMVPNEMSDPSFGGGEANTFVFEEDTRGGWGEWNPNRPETMLWN